MSNTSGPLFPLPVILSCWRWGRVRCFCLSIYEGSCINPIWQVGGPRRFWPKISKMPRPTPPSQLKTYLPLIIEMRNFPGFISGVRRNNHKPKKISHGCIYVPLSCFSDHTRKSCLTMLQNICIKRYSKLRWVVLIVTNLSKTFLLCCILLCRCVIYQLVHGLRASVCRVMDARGNC